MNNLIIFSAQYLYIFEIVIAIIYFLLQNRSKQKSIIALSVVFLPLAYITAQVIAAFYFDPRPFVVGHFTPLILHAPDNGFPSDHMLLTGAIASILFVYNKRVGFFAWVIAIAVGISRVYAGIHHLTDILGSAVIVIVSMWIAKKYILPQVAKTKLYKRYLEPKTI
jgi:undecaprenyl-diphosphatase